MVVPNPEPEGALRELRTALENGRITLAKLGKFTEQEMEGARFCLSQLLVAQRYAEALPVASVLVSLDPYDARSALLLGITLFGLERFEEAVMSYQMALAEDSTDPRIHIYLGETLVALGRTDEGAHSIRDGLDRANHSTPTGLVQRAHNLLAKVSLEASP